MIDDPDYDPDHDPENAPDDLCARLRLEHAEALTLIADLLAADQDFRALRTTLLGELVTVLGAQNTAEEEVLHTRLRAHYALQADVDRATAAHGRTRALLARLDRQPVGDPGLANTARELRSLVQSQFEEEERGLLSKAEEKFGRKSLALLITGFEARKRELEDLVRSDRAFADASTEIDEAARQWSEPVPC